MIGAAFLACRQKPKQPGTTQDAAAASPYFYLQLKGTVGDQPVTMQLLKTAPEIYRGYYCYDRIGEPIDIWGNPDSSHKVILYENSHSDEEISFRGTLSPDGTFKGTWRGAGTSYPFSLKTDFDKAVRLDVYYAKDSTPLLSGHPRSPVGEAANSILWPAGGASESVAALIKKAVNPGKPVNDPQQVVKRSIDSFLFSYKGSAIGFDTTELQDESIGASWNWTSEGDMKVVWNHYPLLVLESFSYDFTGGAHGNGGAHYQVLDLDKEKILSVEDVFKGDYKTVLTRELELAFRKTYKIPENESVKSMLMVDDIAPNENFILTDKGVTFSYTPYEIGAYALGQINLFVPYERIKAVLKEDYSK
jgi:hypothetical protein